MEIKQVIVIARGPSGAARVVYNASGEVCAGNEIKATQIKDARLSVTVRGTKGETTSAEVEDWNGIAGLFNKRTTSAENSEDNATEPAPVTAPITRPSSRRRRRGSSSADDDVT
jgi:hypothetical protein